jgi:(R,R)-butanediol dehydrogenase / meso-butanediol dehydrogenase / diacetyl reductase
MRALVYTESRTLQVLDVPVAPVAPGEASLRVSAAGICGSDVQGVAARSPRRTPPLIMGHELTGEVVEVGDGVPQALIGRHVAVNPQVPCGACSACRSGSENVCQHRELVGGTRPGGFGELVSVPAGCLHALPDGLDAGVGVMAEPLATCVHAVTLMGRVAPRSAVVLGAGAIGVLAVQMLRLIGTEWIAVSDPDGDRRRGVESLADVVVEPAELDAVAGERESGIEVAIDAAGTSSTRRDSLRLLRPLGTAVWLGMHDQDSPIPAFDLVVREQRILGSFAYTNPEFARAVELLSTGQIRPSVSSSLVPLGQSASVFEALVEGRPAACLRSIVVPDPPRL